MEITLRWQEGTVPKATCHFLVMWEENLADVLFEAGGVLWAQSQEPGCEFGFCAFIAGCYWSSFWASLSVIFFMSLTHTLSVRIKWDQSIMCSAQPSRAVAFLQTVFSCDLDSSSILFWRPCELEKAALLCGSQCCQIQVSVTLRGDVKIM